MNHPVGRWLTRLQAVLHQPGLCLQTCIFRSLICLWLVGFYLPRIPYLDELLAREVLREGVVWMRLLGEPVVPLWVAQLVVVLLVVAALLAVAGLRARVTVFVATCLHSLVYMVDQSSPRAYGTLSLAALWILCWAPHETRLRHARVDLWASRLLKIQFASVYWFAAWSKILASNGAWLKGVAIDRILRSQVFGQFLISNYYVDGFADVPWMSNLLSWGTILLELLIAIFLWHRRFWAWAAMACMGLHLGLALSMRVSPLFHTLMVLHLVLFLPDRSVLRAARWMGACTWPRRSS